MADKNNKLQILSEVFSPSAPITSKSSFYGRYEQMNRLQEAIYERGQHIVMYGERGVGKTSLANVAEESSEGMYAVKLTCSRLNNYESLWKEIIKSLKFRIKFGDNENDKSLVRYLTAILEEPFDIQAILFVLGKIKTGCLIILDEFDVITDESTLSAFADTIKSFSDNLPQVTLMFVGIAENISDLIGEHASLERCICQMPIPRMASSELTDIIDSGLLKLKLTMDKQVKHDIVAFSQGFPHYTHLLSKYCVLSAIKKKYNAIVRNNFDEAINEAIENVYESTRFAYQKAVTSNKENSIYKLVVQSCALVKEDEHGTFKSSDLLNDLKMLAGKPIGLKSYSYHMSKLCQENRGAILQKIIFGKQNRYRFKNPI